MLAAVPCADADRVVLLDGADGRERGRIPVGDHPVHLAEVAGAVFVATMGDRAVSVVENGTVTRVETGVLGPSHFAATDGGLVLVPCTGGDALAVIDRESLALVDRVGVGAEPHDVAVREGRAYVGSRGDGTVTVVDSAAGRALRTLDLGDGPRIQGVDAEFGGVYAVDQAGGRIALLSESELIVSDMVGENPYEAAFGPENLYVAGRDDGTVTALSPDLSETTVHDVGGSPSSVVVADGTPWLLDREDARLRAVGSAETISIPYPAFLGYVTPAGSSVIVSHYDDDRVSLVDLEAGETVWTAETPSKPFEPLAL